MKNNHLFIFALGFLVFFQSCEKTETIIDNKILCSDFEQNLLKNSKNKAIVDLTKTISSSLNEKNVRSFLKNEALKRFDGDFDILLSKALNEKISSEIVGVKGLTFKQVLIHHMIKDEPLSYKGTCEASNYLDSIIKIFPLIQISIPEVFDSSTFYWDHNNYLPLTALLPVNFNENTENILAYDVYGNPCILSTNEIPDKPVFVISQNESLVAIPKRNSDNKFKLAPYYETEEYYYFYSEDIETSVDIGEIEIDDELDSTISPIQDGSRDILIGKDFLNKAKFVSKTTWRQVESWPSGRPEFKVVISYAEIVNGNYSVKTITKVLPKDGWISRYVVFNELRTKNLDLPIIKWVKANFGNSMKYTWIEQDPSDSQSTINIGYSTKFEDGDQLSTSISIKTGADDDEAGEDIVDYNDSTTGEGTVYNTGILKFWINQQ